MSSLTADFEFVFLSSSSSPLGTFLMLVSIPSVDHCIVLYYHRLRWKSHGETILKICTRILLNSTNMDAMIWLAFSLMSLEHSGRWLLERKISLEIITKGFSDCIVSIFNSPKPINDHRYCANKSPQISVAIVLRMVNTNIWWRNDANAKYAAFQRAYWALDFAAETNHLHLVVSIQNLVLFQIASVVHILSGNEHQFHWQMKPQHHICVYF